MYSTNPTQIFEMTKTDYPWSIAPFYFLWKQKRNLLPSIFFKQIKELNSKSLMPRSFFFFGLFVLAPNSNSFLFSFSHALRLRFKFKRYMLCFYFLLQFHRWFFFGSLVKLFCDWSSSFLGFSLVLFNFSFDFYGDCCNLLYHVISSFWFG